jgi:hypothetical protein
MYGMYVGKNVTFFLEHRTVGQRVPLCVVVVVVVVVVVIVAFIGSRFVSLIAERNGPGSSVGIATGCGVEGPGFESRWGDIFRTYPDRRWSPPNLLFTMGTGSFPGVKIGRCVTLTPHQLLVPLVMKE